MDHFPMHFLRFSDTAVSKCYFWSAPTLPCHREFSWWFSSCLAAIPFTAQSVVGVARGKQLILKGLFSWNPTLLILPIGPTQNYQYLTIPTYMTYMGSSLATRWQAACWMRSWVEEAKKWVPSMQPWPGLWDPPKVSGPVLPLPSSQPSPYMHSKTFKGF